MSESKRLFDETAALPTEITDLTALEFVLEQPADILGLVGAGAGKLILTDRQLPPEFFDLSTGFAGELVQKCMNYRLRVALIVTDPSAPRSLSFRQFASETGRGANFFLVDSKDAALARLR